MAFKDIEKYSPMTGEVLSTYCASQPEEIDKICKQAKLAFLSWKNSDIVYRQKIINGLIKVINRNKEKIINTIVEETAKPYCEAETEVIESCDVLSYFCTEVFEGVASPKGISLDLELWPQKEAYCIYQPHGIFAVVKPWNYPFEMPIWSIAPLLVAGNTIIFKPSEHSTATGMLLNELMNKAGFPKGVFNIVIGDGAVGEYLVERDEIGGVSFTGSTKVGERILNITRRPNMKLSLEMGGSDFAIVKDDCNPQIAVPGIVWGSFTNSGQVCVSIEKALIQERVYGEIVAALKVATEDLRINYEIPPMISLNQYKRARDVLLRTLDDGCKIVSGEIPAENPDNGYYMKPIIIECLDKQYLNTIPELFAPMLFVAPYKTEQEAIQIIEGSEYGLGCSIWTEHPEKCDAIVSMVDVGMIWFNEVNLPMPQVPWLGRRQSCIGLNLSKKSVYESMNLKVIHCDYSNTPREWWFPYQNHCTA